MRLVKHDQEITVPVTRLANAMISFFGWARAEDQAVVRSGRDECDHGHSFLKEEEAEMACISDEGPDDQR
jgi:hypothetical protein